MDITKVVTEGTYLLAGGGVRPFRYVTSKVTKKHEALREQARAAGRYCCTTVFGPIFMVCEIACVERQVLAEFGDRAEFLAAYKALQESRRTTSRKVP